MVISNGCIWCIFNCCSFTEKYYPLCNVKLCKCEKQKEDKVNFHSFIFLSGYFLLDCKNIIMARLVTCCHFISLYICGKCPQLVNISVISFFFTSALRDLNLSNNKFSELPKGEFREVTKTDHMYLSSFVAAIAPPRQMANVQTS